MGEISADGLGMLRLWAKETWRIGEDGAFRNRTNNVSKVLEMPLAFFCKNYLIEGECKNDYLQQCQEEYRHVYSQIPELPFSNIWVAQQLSNLLPSNSNIYLGILGSVRSWNFFKLPIGVSGTSNVGGYGIDGTISSAIGQAIVNPKKLVFCVLGDLAFFYDMNALGNRHVGDNLRILLINNGLGDEFRVYDNPTGFMGEIVRPYIAAEGHFGKQSLTLVKSYAESLGYKYMMADDKCSFIGQMSDFVNPNINHSMIFEVMIRPEDDTDALDMMKHIIRKSHQVSLKKKIKSAIKESIGEEKLEALRTLLK